jgi:hypothetical protein
MFFSLSCFVTWRAIHGVVRGTWPLSVVHAVHDGCMSVIGSNKHLVMRATLFHLFPAWHVYCRTEQTRVFVSRRAEVETIEGLRRWRYRRGAGGMRHGVGELMMCVSVELLSIEIGSRGWLRRRTGSAHVVNVGWKGGRVTRRGSVMHVLSVSQLLIEMGVHGLTIWA